MSKNFKSWYAMRKRLQDSGSWKGKAPSHQVPAQEEGEPPSKQPRVASPPENQEAIDGGTEDPEEGTSKKAQGKLNNDISILDALWQALELQADSLSWLGLIPTPGDLKAWIKSNAMIKKKNSLKTLVPCYVGDGVWRVPLWKIAGLCTPSSAVHVLWFLQRHLLGL